MGYNITPSNTQSATTTNYVNSQAISSSLTNLNMEKPQVDPSIVRGFRGSLTTFIKSEAAMNGINNQWYSHAEKDWIRDIVKLNASVATGSAGSSVVVTLAAAYDYDVSNSAAPEYIASGNTTTYMPIDGDILVLPNATAPIQVLVSGVNRSTGAFTITPLLAGDTIPATGTTDELIRIGTAFPEGSSAPVGRNTRISGYENNIQSFRDSFKVTGTASSNMTWFTNLGANENGFAWYLEGLEDATLNHGLDCELTLLIGEKATNTTMAALSGQGTTITTEGLVPYIESNGQRVDYGGGTFDLADLETMGAAIWKYQGDSENYFWTGYSLSIDFDTEFRALAGLTAGGIQYSALSEEKAVNLGFKSVTYGNITYHKKVLEVFTQPNMLNAAGLPYDGMGLVIPAGNVNAPKDGLSGQVETVPSLRVNYLDREDAVNGYKEWPTGGALLSTPTDDEDAMTVHMLTQEGLEAFAGHRFGQIYT